MTGWEVMNMGQGSTGYTNNGGNVGGKDYYGASSRMSALAALPALDLIMVYGSGNDSSQTQSALQTAANTLWNAIKAARPATPIVVAGMQPGSISGFNDALMDASNGYLKAAAKANPNVAGFIDMRDSTDPWMVGTGNTSAPNDTGNADFFISPDTVHPTRIGYYNMAYKMVDALCKIKV
jgi:lysophospholipase L1-like esterase